MHPDPLTVTAGMVRALLAEQFPAWAFAQAMGLAWYYVSSNPTMAFVGRRTLDRLLQASGETG